MKNESSDFLSCPSDEALAEFADCPDSSDIKRHIECCEKCQEILRQHKLISILLARSYQPPAGLAERVKSACYKRAQHSSSFPRYFWCSAAALFAIIASLQVVLTFHGIQPSSKQAVVAQAESTANNAFDYLENKLSSAKVPVSKLSPAENVPRLAATEEKRVPVFDSALVSNAPEHTLLFNNDLAFSRPVATNSYHEYELLPDTMKRIQREIPGQVTHIWKPGSMLSLQAALHHRNCTMASLDGTHSGYDLYTVTGTDSEIQSLVNDLHQSNWTLYSPDFPQPDQQAFTHLTDKLVRYQLKVLK